MTVKLATMKEAFNNWVAMNKRKKLPEPLWMIYMRKLFQHIESLEADFKDEHLLEALLDDIEQEKED